MSEQYGGIIMETATLGPDPTPAIGIGALQWVGARFTVFKNVEVDHIGVNLAGAQTIFGAIVPLSGPDGLPTFSPDQIESFALAHTTFTAPAAVADLSLPLSVTLAPGNYGVVFGIGAFGAGGGANLTSGNQPTAQSSFFTAEFLNSPIWLNQPAFSGLRIFVLGS
jgi:hypothetical protein